MRKSKDPVSIYTLTMAALGVLRDLSKHHGESSVLDEVEAWIRPEKREHFWGLFRRPANFMKHAHRDPVEVLENFRPRINEGMLLVCTMLLMEQGLGNRGRLLSFWVWFTATHPEFVKEPAPEAARSEVSKMIERARKLMGSESKAGSLDLLRRVLRHFDAVVEG